MPDHNTICDFETVLDEDRVKLINEYAVKWAAAEKLADPRGKTHECRVPTFPGLAGLRSHSGGDPRALFFDGA
jgi:hypothetical protein